MAHFFGGIQGNRGEATRAGSKDSGISAYVQGWHGRISSRMFSAGDRDMGYVTLSGGPRGSGESVNITGTINVQALTEAADFDSETQINLRKAREYIQRANARACKVIELRDRDSRKVA